MDFAKYARVLTLVPCLAVISCAEQAEEGGMEMASVDMQALETAMADVSNAWEQAYEAGNVADLAGLYADDAYYMPPYQEAIHGQAAIESYLSGMMAQTSNRAITIERTDFGGSGDLSYSIGTYSVEMGMAGAEQPITDAGKYLTLARRGADGSWQIAAHIWNTSKSQAEVAQELAAMAEASEMSESEM